MRNYLLRYELSSVEGPDNLEDAKEYFQNKILYPQLVDVQQIPRGAGGTTEPVLPEVHVVHPWDQGLWIFPDDHPLAGYERAAKMNDRPNEKQAFLEAGRLMLPPGDDPDGR